MKHATAKSYFDAAMWAILAILVTIGIASAFGCGAPTDEDLEFMQVEQDVVAQEGWGVRSDVALPNEGGLCSPTAPTTQACNFPSKKAISFKCTFANADENQLCNELIPERINSWNNQLGAASGWSLTQANPQTEAFCNITKAVLAGPFTVTDIRPYILVTPLTVSSSLTEAGSYPGTYRKYSQMSCKIDKKNIDLQFAQGGDTARFRAFSHALSGCMAACIGAGYSTTLTTRPNSTIVNVGALQSTQFDSRTLCRLRAYDPAGTDLTLSNGC